MNYTNVEIKPRCKSILAIRNNKTSSKGRRLPIEQANYPALKTLSLKITNMHHFKICGEPSLESYRIEMKKT